jgi:hypothetical protein
MKMYRGVEMKLYILLTSALDGGGQLHVPAALLQQKKQLYPFVRKVGVPQSQSRRGKEEEKKNPCPCRE